MKTKKSNFGVVIFYLLLFGAIILALTFLFTKKDETEKIEYSQIVDYFKDDQVKSFVIDNSDNIVLQVYDAEKLAEAIAATPEGQEPDLSGVSTFPVEYKLQSLELFINDCGQYYSEKNGNQNLLT